MQLLSEKVGIVTGGGQGIGRAICEVFAREGAKVVVAELNPESGQETVELIKAAGGDATFVETNVIDEAQVEAMVKTAIDTYGKLDIACNSAAVSRGQGSICDFSKEEFDATLSLSLTNTWLCMKHEIAGMKDGGAIVNISSNASLRGHPFNTPYAAAKGGVNILTKSSAVEFGPKGIRINAVAPGVIRTPGVERYFKEQPEMEKQLKRQTLFNRLGEPTEIAEAVAFLCSDRASFITGQLLSVDGGGAVK